MKGNQYIKIYRTKVLEGVSIPAIIHNGTYFFTHIDVYEDGRVDCWDFKDFELFKQKVSSGWVKTYIPDGKDIHIHGLGSWKIANGRWQFIDNDSFISFVESIVQELNPSLQNIYKYVEKKVNGIVIGEGSNGSIFKEVKKSKNDLFPDKIKGDGFDIFLKHQGQIFLVRVLAFADNKIQIHGLSKVIEISFSEFQTFISEGVLFTEVSVGSIVEIYGFGIFEILEASYNPVPAQEKANELSDILAVLNNKPSSIAVCSSIYEQYLQNPTKALRQLLKDAYEKIPKHRRAYVGDMDTKDIAVRMIIYSENEIENWSHYQIAKSRGEKLPSITIPRPKDE